jgi:hypothetical protein
LLYARGAGAEKCPDEDAFRKEVASRLGYDPFFPYASRTVSVEIEFANGKGTARVVFVDDKAFELGAQTIEGGPACEPLVRSAALAVSVSLEAVALADPPPADPPSIEEKKDAAVVVEPTPSIEVVVPRKAPVHETPRLPAPTRYRPVLSIAPQLWGGYGQWPVATFGIGWAVEVRYRALGVALEGRWDAPATLDFASGGSVQMQRGTGSLVPCGHFGVLALCGVASLGESWANGIDVTNARTAAAFYAAFGARVGLDVPLGSRFRWSFAAQAAAIATPMHIVVGVDRFDSAPVDASIGSSLAMSIF